VREQLSIWERVKRLLIVLPYNEELEYFEYLKALDEILNESNVQDLKIIVPLPKEVKKEILPTHRLIQYFSPKDLSFFGKLRDEEMERIIVQPYDALIWFYTDDRRLFKLLKNIHAPWKIGVNINKDFFSLHVESKGEKPSDIVYFTIQTLTKISGNE
jgi:hypothetical protein